MSPGAAPGTSPGEAPTVVDVREDDDVLVLSVVGDLDRAARDPLLEGYDRVRRTSGARRVLLDLALCAYISSTGIALLVGLLARCQADGRPLAAAGLSEHYRRVFDLTRLSERMTVMPPSPQEPPP